MFPADHLGNGIQRPNGRADEAYRLYGATSSLIAEWRLTRFGDETPAKDRCAACEVTCQMLQPEATCKVTIEPVSRTVRDDVVNRSESGSVPVNPLPD
jgi:hypothetical protein